MRKKSFFMFIFICLFSRFAEGGESYSSVAEGESSVESKKIQKVKSLLSRFKKRRKGEEAQEQDIKKEGIPEKKTSKKTFSKKKSSQKEKEASSRKESGFGYGELMLRATQEHMEREVTGRIKDAFPEGSDSPDQIAKKAVEGVVTGISQIPVAVGKSAALLKEVREINGDKVLKIVGDKVNQAREEGLQVFHQEKEALEFKKSLSVYLSEELNNFKNAEDSQKIFQDFEDHRKALSEGLEGVSSSKDILSPKEKMKKVWEKEFLKYQSEQSYIQGLEEKIAELKQRASQAQGEEKKNLLYQQTALQTLEAVYRNSFEQRKALLQEYSVSPVLPSQVKEIYYGWKPNLEKDPVAYEVASQRIEEKIEASFQEIKETQNYLKEKVAEKEMALEKCEEAISHLTGQQEQTKQVLSVSDPALKGQLERLMKTREILQEELEFFKLKTYGPVEDKIDPETQKRKISLLTPQNFDEIEREFSLKEEVTFKPNFLKSVEGKMEKLRQMNKNLEEENLVLSQAEPMTAEIKEKISFNKEVIKKNNQFLSTHGTTEKEAQREQEKNSLEESISHLKRLGEKNPWESLNASPKEGWVNGFVNSLLPWGEVKEPPVSQEVIENLKASPLAYQEHIKSLAAPSRHPQQVEGVLADLTRMKVDLQAQNEDLKNQLESLKNNKAKGDELEKKIEENKKKIQSYNEQLHQKRTEILEKAGKIATDIRTTPPKNFADAWKLYKTFDEAKSGVQGFKNTYEVQEKRRLDLVKENEALKEDFQQVPRNYSTQKIEVLQVVHDQNKKVLDKTAGIMEQVRGTMVQHQEVDQHMASLREKVPRLQGLRK